MELELKKSHIHGYDLLLECTVPHEETVEMIVPDTCPDIGQILDTEAHCFLRTKEPKEGRVDITGLVRTTVLYCPEEVEGTRKLEFQLPVTCHTDQAGIGSGCKIVVCSRIEGAEARMLNSRKVLLRVHILFDIAVYSAMEQAICYGALGEEDWGLQILPEVEDSYTTVCVQEKQFTHSDHVSVSGNRSEIQEILKSRLHLACQEKKVIGNKLIVKGVAYLQVLYRGEVGALCTSDHELPFSQIMEIYGTGEECDILVTPVLTSGEFHLVGNDGRTIGVNLGILLQSTLKERICLPVLKDLYSTGYELELEEQHHEFCRLVDRGTKSQTERNLVALEPPPNAVCDVYIEMGSVGQGREGTSMTLSTQCQITVLYEEGEGDVKSHLCIIPVTCEIEVPEDAICYCACDGEVYATPTAGGIEVRLVVTFSYCVCQHRTVQSICGGQLIEKEVGTNEQKPSVILRMVGPDDRLWDVAKNYGTTVDEIRSANQLEEDTLVEQLLLIPKKRA